MHIDVIPLNIVNDVTHAMENSASLNNKMQQQTLKWTSKIVTNTQITQNTVGGQSKGWIHE